MAQYRGPYTTRATSVHNSRNAPARDSRRRIATTCLRARPDWYADAVTCLTFYRGDANKTACYATAADCEVGHAAFTSPDYGARPEQLTRCTKIDQSFQPKG